MSTSRPPRQRIKKEEEEEPDLTISPSRPGSSSGIIQSLVSIPLNVASTTFRLARPFAPQILPLVILLLALPLLALLSVGAGWYVWRSVAVGWETEVYLQYGDGGPPYAEVRLPPLVQDQAYDISLRLSVPATESNYALGNFMTALMLSASSTNSTLAFVRRPTLILPPSASLLSFLRKGLVNLDVPLLDSYTASARNVFAKIELGRRDGWRSLGRGEGRELSVLSASLKGVVIPRGIRGLVIRFPLTFAAIASAMFLVASLITFLACLFPAMRSRTYRELLAAPREQSPAVKKEEGEGGEKPARRRTSRRSLGSGGAGRGRRRSLNVGVASTSEERPPPARETVIPTASDERAMPLRRRRSRTSAASGRGGGSRSAGSESD